MISSVQARNWLSDRSPEQVESLALARLRGTNTEPAGSGRDEEAPEDVLVALLGDPTLPRELRASILRACTDLYEAAVREIALTGTISRGPSMDEATFQRLSRLVDYSAPAELRPFATAVLHLLAPSVKVSEAILTAAARAAFRFHLGHVDAPLWSGLLSVPAVAGYAIQALARIGIETNDLVDAILTLWQSRLAKAWDIDIPFLLRRVASLVGGTDLIATVLLAARRMPAWTQIQADLDRRHWSHEWLQTHTPESVRPVSFELYTTTAYDRLSSLFGDYSTTIPTTPGYQTIGVASLRGNLCKRASDRITYVDIQQHMDPASRSITQSLVLTTAVEDFTARKYFNLLAEHLDATVHGIRTPRADIQRIRA